MIELKDDGLVFKFPKVHPEAEFSLDFQRTLRIPDDDKTYSLPPGLGRFPLRHVDDRAARVPGSWIEHGGVMLPMYQSEALWLNFSTSFVEGRACYPFAVKVATGKVDAVTGETWSNGLHSSPQDYLVAPTQPWLDGYCVEKGTIRQFVAMPLGSGYTAEEQVTGEAEHGGIQIIVYPMKREVFERRFSKRRHMIRSRAAGASSELGDLEVGTALEMGLAPGGRMRQEIFADPFDFSDWDTTASSRCYVHVANSLVWRAITDGAPPTVPPTAKEYTRAGLPWFDYYSDGQPVEGSGTLAKLKSVLQIGKEKGDVPLPENESVTPENVIGLVTDLAPGQVREGRF